MPESDALPVSSHDDVFGDTPPGDQTADREPMRAAHTESPFEEPVVDYSAAAVTVEKPVGVHIEEPPPVADVAETPTMADLYAKQGAPEKAREIYESILHREPENVDVRSKLQDLGGGAHKEKVNKLEQWLAKVKKREQGSVI